VGTRVGQVHPPDDAGDERRARGDIEQEGGLGRGLRRLHQHAARDPVACKEGGEVGRPIVPMEDTDLGRHPVVVAAIDAPEVLVRVQLERRIA